MLGRRVAALALVICLTGSALAFHDTYNYDGFDRESLEGMLAEDGSVLRAQGQPVLQQHATFVELIEQDRNETADIQPFAAVVGVVKRCIQVRNVFDNAVLWFNDRFLFGAKRSRAGNVTEGEVISYQPTGTISQSDVEDNNRKGGNATYDPSTGRWAPAGSGTDEQAEGGNPDRDGFVRRQDNMRRWGGCFTPNGYVHAVGDGQTGKLNVALTSPDNDCDWTDPGRPAGKRCEFTYNGTLFITDPNNHRWMIDRYLWGPGNQSTVYTGHLQVDPWNPDKLGFPDEAIWTYAEDGRLRAGMPYTEDPGNRCHDAGFGNQPARHAGSRGSADAYRYETSPPGMASGERGPIGTHVECSIEYNFLLAVDMLRFELRRDAEAHGDGRTDSSSGAWAGNSHPHNRYDCYADPAPGPYPQGSYGVTINEVEANPAGPDDGAEFVELYNPHPDRPIDVTGWRLEAHGPRGTGGNATLSGVIPGQGYKLVTLPVAWLPDGKTIISLDDHRGRLVDVTREKHADHADDDRSWQRVVDNAASWRLEEATPGASNGGSVTAGQACSSGPAHDHEAVRLDILFHERAPWFTEAHPYWDNPGRCDPDAAPSPHREPGYLGERWDQACLAETHGTPPEITDDCTTTALADDHGRAAVEARWPAVCDVDAMDGYHLHDGSQTVPLGADKRFH